MTVEEQEPIKQKGYADAMRYIANAKVYLSNSGMDGRFYTDAKYVRGASGIAYSGVLVALDVLAEIKKVPNPKKGSRKSVNFYRDILKDNQKLQTCFDTVYKDLHLSGYYDGNLDSTVIKSGFEIAKELINLIKPRGVL
ncbi:MAG: DUF5618 family protein [Fibromonadaceae bacterium]|jgi:hypothetical protein|nr:DUF5618 family protein [Fibromonadaceae bacterium]